MAYDPFLTQGTQLQVKIAAAFVLVPGAQNIDGPTGTKTQKEFTALNDTAAKYKAGLPDYGDVSFDLFYDPADPTHQKLFNSYKTSGSVDEFKIILSDAGAAEVDFAGSVSGWKLSLAQGDFGKVAVTIKVSGDVAVTP